MESQVIKIPVQSFKILLLSNLKEYFHGVSIVIDFSKPRKVFLNLVPLSSQGFFLKIFHVEKEARFLLQSKLQQTYISNLPQANEIQKNINLNKNRKGAE